MSKVTITVDLNDKLLDRIVSDSDENGITITKKEAETVVTDFLKNLSNDDQLLLIVDQIDLFNY
jgi:hypothetical protein